MHEYIVLKVAECAQSLFVPNVEKNIPESCIHLNVGLKGCASWALWSSF